MQKHYRNIGILFLVVAVCSFAMGFGARRYSARQPSGRSLWLASLTGGRGMSRSPSQTFAAVLDNLEDSYVDKIPDEKPLTYGALRQMMDELDDPNSRFLDPTETRDVLDAEDGVFHGIGAVVNIESTHLKDGERRRAVVANVLPGSPAELAGLHAGDVIAKIDDQWVYEPHTKVRVTHRLPKPETASDPTAPGHQREPEHLPAPEASTADEDDAVLVSTHDIQQKLSEDGKHITLTVLGKDNKSLETVDVDTAPTRVRAVEITKSGPDVAEVRIGGFTKTIGPDLDAALARVHEDGAKQLVLDLRDCVGGPVDRAVQVASRFMEGSLGTVDRRSNGKITRVPLTVRRTENAWTGRMVVMVDRGTLGAAELLAGGLAAKNHATLVGVRTFGDGMEHTVIPLRDGSSLLMTTGKYYTSGGESFQAKGVSPGVAVASAAEQSAAALRVLRGMKG